MKVLRGYWRFSDDLAGKLMVEMVVKEVHRLKMMREWQRSVCCAC